MNNLIYLEELKNQTKRFDALADMHTHTISSDGIKTADSLVKDGKNRGLKFLAITDHNTNGQIKGVGAYIKDKKAETSDIFVDCDGLALIPGVEVTSTCYMKYTGDRERRRNIYFQKIHMIVLGADRNPEFAFNKLMLLKYKSDLLTHFGMFGYCNKEFGTDFSISDAKKLENKERFKNPSFDRFSSSQIAKIAEKQLKEQGKDISYKQITENFKNADIDNRLNNPRVTKFTLSAEDVITMAKCAGGTTIWAHPFIKKEEFDREIDRSQVCLDKLLELGIDGYEKIYPRNPEDKKFENNLIKSKVEQGAQLLTSGGSDFHNSAFSRARLGLSWGKNIGAGSLSVIDSLIDKQKERTIALTNNKPLPYGDNYLSAKLFDKYSMIYSRDVQKCEDMVKFNEIDAINLQLKNTKDYYIDARTIDALSKQEIETIREDKIRYFDSFGFQGEKEVIKDWKDILKEIDFDSEMGDE